MLKSYHLPNVNGEGYAYILLDLEKNMFATVSDWGNYACRWSAPGPDFRRFLARCDGDYVRGYLINGRVKLSRHDDVQSKMFVTKVWPRFVEALRKELDEEKEVLQGDELCPCDNHRGLICKKMSTDVFKARKETRG